MGNGSFQSERLAAPLPAAIPSADLNMHEMFMQAALAQAKKGLGRTSPNPAVGAILVRGNDVLARGFHRRAGSRHAEVECLRRVRDLRGATLYVTLEPCSTRGRTGPCVDYLIARQVPRVVIGAKDPNPLHSGRGIELLRRAQVDVVAGILERECSQLNEAFNKWIVRREPFVVAKCAMSLDGRLTRAPGESRWLSSPASRAHAQQLRAQVDAILVGAETIRRDNPRLTVRPAGARKQPWRIILTRSGVLPSDSWVFRAADQERTLVFRDQSLPSVLRELGKREILSVLIEGGGEILSEALDEGMIDKFQIYIAPLFTGGNVLAFGGDGAGSTDDALRLGRVRYEGIGSDICVTGYPMSQPIPDMPFSCGKTSLNVSG